MNKIVGDVPGHVLGMLEDLMLKLRKGVLSPEELELFLKKKNPFALASDLLLDWQNFWKRMGVEADLRKVKIPKRSGFERTLFIPHGMTPQKAYDLCAGKFNCWKSTNSSLDEAIGHEDRTAKNGAYAVSVRERIEPDEELKHRSANDLVNMEIAGNTLTEALVYELKYNDETGLHLNLVNWNLCSGSRISGGRAPYVYRDASDGDVGVYCTSPSFAYDYLRARQVVF